MEAFVHCARNKRTPQVKCHILEHVPYLIIGTQEEDKAGPQEEGSFFALLPSSAAQEPKFRLTPRGCILGPFSYARRLPGGLSFALIFDFRLRPIIF